jgi:spore coat protein A
MIDRRNFLRSSTALAALAAAGLGGPQSAEAFRRRHPRGIPPAPPFDVNKTPKFASVLPNPLDPTYPGLRRPPAHWASTMTIREVSAPLGLKYPNGAPVSTRVWAYDLDGRRSPVVPGPTIEVSRGAPLTLTFVNGLEGVPQRMPVDTTLEWANPGELQGLAPVPLTTHLHGSRSESRSDGLPDAWSTPGNVYTGRLFSKPYRYANDQEAAHFWYHDHVLGVTRLNVNMGLAGFYFIRDANEDYLRLANVLPSWPFEVPLMFLDRMFDAAGQLFYPSTDPTIDVSPTHLPEFFGDALLVNGAPWPKMKVEQRKYRFRMLNACDSRFMALKIQTEAAVAGAPSKPSGNRLPIMVIGNELGLLDKPVNATWTSADNADGPGITQSDTLLIGPGERYDIVLDFSNVPVNTRLLMWNDAAIPYNGQPADGADYTAPVPGLTDRVMAFDVVPRNRLLPSASVTTNTFLRPKLGALPAVNTAGAKPRKILMVEGTDQHNRLQTMLGTVADGTKVYRDPVTETPKVGTTELWEFHNTTADAHPIHMHLVDFRIVNRQNFKATLLPKKFNSDGSTGATVDGGEAGIDTSGQPIVPPLPHETGRKDTVVCYPGQITRVLVSFPKAGEYVYHCHILSHEDHEMMRRYIVS